MSVEIANIRLLIIAILQHKTCYRTVGNLQDVRYTHYRTGKALQDGEAYRTLIAFATERRSLQDAHCIRYRTLRCRSFVSLTVVRSQASWSVGTRSVDVFAGAKGVCQWQGVSRSEVEVRFFSKTYPLRFTSLRSSP